MTSSWKITYRNDRGALEEKTVDATSEPDARTKFQQKYSGRIITVEATHG